MVLIAWQSYQVSGCKVSKNVSDKPLAEVTVDMVELGGWIPGLSRHFLNQAFTNAVVPPRQFHLPLVR